MWSDNETKRDFLNFNGVADTVAEIIVQSGGRPISIGVSGAWGVGKSSMIKLIRGAIEERRGEFVIVEFNAWLYQGYDDARAALLDVIATALNEEAEKRKSGLDKAKELFKRINLLRVAKLTAGSALPLMLGLPPVGPFLELVQAYSKISEGKADKETAATMSDVAQRTVDGAAALIKPKLDSTPPREIQAVRDCFKDTLAELGVKLVVLIDDLDRCLPPTTISTLEAIRLFLFIEHTAFVIAADDAMIKHAVRIHFGGADDTLVSSYFDKLIQVPIRVPPLGTQEVRAYLMMLFVENSALSDQEKEDVRVKVCTQLGQTWRGSRVDRAFMATICPSLPRDLLSRFDTADRLAPLMTGASQIAGNPRLIKRFLNAVSIRMAISTSHGVGVDEAVLAKMLLFERCAVPAAYAWLIKEVNNADDGKPRFLDDWEEKAISSGDFALSDPWDTQFVREWLTMPPRLADLDLRGILYVSREHAPLITPRDRLSSEGAEVLTAILEHPDMASEMIGRLGKIPRPEMTIIMDRLLERARQVQEWGTPPILEACLAVTSADLSQGSRLATFLIERPSSQIKPGIVPKIGDQHWAEHVFDTWSKSDVGSTVKKAITQRRKKNGDV